MAGKSIVAKYKDHEIAVEASKSGGCAMYIDGKPTTKYMEKVDSDSLFPITKSKLKIDQLEESVEVHAAATLFSFKVKISVNGRRIAGDDF